jgi:cobalt-zinc-cadmium efflux system protein
MAFAGHSLALLADAGHMLTDAGALGASLLAIRLARRPASGVWTFGFKRAEVLSAQANGITLLVISALVTFEAISRLIHPVPVTGGIVVTVAAVGVAVNVAATWVLARANRDSINVRGAFAHVVTDLYGFIGTLRRELEQLLCERFALDHTTLQVDHAPGELLTLGDAS